MSLLGQNVTATYWRSTAVLQFLDLIAQYTLQSVTEYSNGTADSYVVYVVRNHMKVHISKTVFTACNVQLCNWHWKLQNFCTASPGEGHTTADIPYLILYSISAHDAHDTVQGPSCSVLLTSVSECWYYSRTHSTCSFPPITTCNQPTHACIHTHSIHMHVHTPFHATPTHHLTHKTLTFQ